MELLDPNIEESAKDSVIKSLRKDNEGKCRPATMEEEPENTIMMSEFSKKPEKPKGVISDDKGLIISWDVSPCTAEVIDVFEMQWKKAGEKRWSGRQCTDDNSTQINIPITELEMNTAYQFKVRWITKDGAESPFSDISDNIIINTSQKPEKLKGIIRNDKDLLISWDIPSSDLQAVDIFEIQWKKAGEKRWSGRQCTDDNSMKLTIPITELEMNTAYQFKVRWITKDGAEGPFSDISDDIIIKMSQKPEKPKGITGNDDLLISWDVPLSNLQAEDIFEIQWKKTGENRWPGRQCTDDNSTNITIPITKLEINTAYKFKVRWITKEGVESPFSDISDDIIITTTQKPEKPKWIAENDNDLLISWNVSSSNLEAVDIFEIQWKKTEDKRWAGRKCTEDNSTKLTIPITELKMNTAYQFKVRWISKDGAESPFSDISDDIIIKASQKPEKPKVIIRNDKDILISWNVSSSNLQAVDIFEIQWKKTGENRWPGRQCTDDNSTNITIPITKLEINTAYEFKVRWITKEGVESPFSDISDDIIITTSQKPEKPKGITEIDKDLLISWEVQSSDLQAIHIFEIQWKKTEDKRWTGRKYTDNNSTKLTIPITELEMNTAYQFKVRWITKDGAESPFSDISDDIIIKTLQKPEKPKVIIRNDKDILISWNAPSSDLQNVDNFEIQWKKTEEKRWSGRKCTNNNRTSIDIPIIELEKNTAYQFRVRWITTEGVESQFSNVSDDIMIKMSRKPEKPKAVISNNNYLLITWGISLPDLQDVDVFEIQWKKKDETRWPGLKKTDDNSTSITIPITELEKNTAYQFKVRWTTKDGSESMFSEISEDVIIVRTKKPDKPKVVRRNDKEVVICWDVSPSDLHVIGLFEIKWKKKDETIWSGLKCTDDNSTSIVIPVTEFANNNTYQFKVKWTTKNGECSPFSEISDDVLITAPVPTRSLQQPGKVKSSKTTATAVCLYWTKPEGMDIVCYYEIKYRSCGELQWLTFTTKGPTESLDLKDLKSKNDYEFKVRAIFTDGNEGPFSEVSDTVTTQESLASRMKTKATELDSGNPQIYKIPLTFSQGTTNREARTRKVKFGERDQLRSTKTIMVVGATGAGKSTMIDGMINYIVDVAWEDDFRFTMIDLTEDEKAAAHQQTRSQTSWITCYEVNYQHGSRLNYNLNIIDTPGFGDTRGFQHDQQIVDQIREFFTAPGDQGINSITAICFITQAPLGRLTHTQKYVFDAILSVFGKNVRDNIFALITFADGKEPPVIAALKEAKVPFQKAFNFNNSALFECIDSSEHFAQMFWKLGITSFDKFFDELNLLQEKSLRQTSEVLYARKQIENTIDRLQPQIRDGLHELNTMKEETEILKKHDRDIQDNRNFTYKSKEIHQREVPTKQGQYVTNCRRCNFTCHENCAYGDDSDKAKCCAMNSNGNCNVCKDHCHWTEHKNNSFYYETYIEEKEKTYEQMKAKYDSAVADKEKQTTVIEKIKSVFKTLGRELMKKMKIVRENVNKLEQFALKPDPLNEVKYVELLIYSEKKEMSLGWEERVQMLEGIKSKAALVKSAQNEWTDEDVEQFLAQTSSNDVHGS